MFEKELMIAGIRKQHDLLRDLIEGLEAKPRFDAFDLSFYEERTKQVARNLKRLRRIKADYCAYGELPGLCQ